MAAGDVILNGTTFNASQFTANGGYGYVSVFPTPILSDMLAEIETQLTGITARLMATSTTSLAIGTGAKSLTIQVSKAFADGQYVVIYKDVSNYMIGTVTSYNEATGALVVNVPADHAIGSGTYATWSVQLCGFPLPTSAAGPNFVSTPTAPAPAGGDDSTYLANTAWVQDELAAATEGKQTIWVPANAMYTRTTNGAAAGASEMVSNYNIISGYDFDASTPEYTQFCIGWPKSSNESTVTFEPVWTHGSTTTDFKVSWGLQAVGVGDDSGNGDALDVAFGTVIYSNDTGGTTNDVYVGPESNAITISNLTEKDLVMFQVVRKADDATNDTLAVDARLLGIRLYYTTNAGTDT